MIFLVIALGLALVYAVIKPLGDGLFDTSMWAAKLMAPTDIGDNEDTKRFLRFGQAALMEGWLSNVPLISMAFFYASVIVAFFYHWWAAILMFFFAVTLGVFTKLFWGGSVSYYMSFLHHKLVHRAANYKRDNDAERSEAAESMLRDLEEITSIYHGSRLRPPTPKQLKDVPYGDLYYWLDRVAGGA
jgi:ABC-type multidrug transport system fused ATPase/permease subunit